MVSGIHGSLVPADKGGLSYVHADRRHISWGCLSLNPLLCQEKLLHLLCALIKIIILMLLFLNGITLPGFIWAFGGHSGNV